MVSQTVTGDELFISAVLQLNKNNIGRSKNDFMLIF